MAKGGMKIGEFLDLVPVAIQKRILVTTKRKEEDLRSWFIPGLIPGYTGADYIGCPILRKICS